MSFEIYPGYEEHLKINETLAHGTDEEKKEAFLRQQKNLKEFTLPEGMVMEDREIPGTEPGQMLKIRIYRPKNAEPLSPVILEVHGGGWIGGNLDIDNHRCVYLAEHTPAVVVGVEYRLAGKNVHFPAPLKDCVTALRWICEHGRENGMDPERIGLHGTSAGGNLVAGLALWVRDHGGPEISLAAINCPVLTSEHSTSFYQNMRFALGPDVSFLDQPESIYAPADGTPKSYYAFPGLCPDLSGLCPHFIVVAEYDQLRDEGLEYGMRLLKAGVHCEMIQAPRVGHGFCVVHHPLADWVHDGICASFRREFGWKK